MGYSPWGRKESDTTEQLHHFSIKKRFQLLVLTMFSHYFLKLFHVALPFILVCILSHINIRVCVYEPGEWESLTLVWVCIYPGSC